MRQLLADIGWAVLMFRARRFRRDHGQKARKRFDDALPPAFAVAYEMGNLNDPGRVTARFGYPHAVYIVCKTDLDRAMEAARTQDSP